MRVIAGQWRGRRIDAPRGRETRPTSDRVREAVFSALEARMGSWQAARVIDLYAGSGALGIEALSRGASHVTFVESSGKAVACIRRNLAALGVDDTRATVLTVRAETAAPTLIAPLPVSLLFADPPYRMDAAVTGGLLQALADARAVRSGTLVVYEHAAGTLPVWPSGYAAELPRRYGDTAVSFALYEG